MPGSKPGALPLGDTPPEYFHFKPCFINGYLFLSNYRFQKYGWGTWIRTRVCQDQNLVPYRLAIPHLKNNTLKLKTTLAKLDLSATEEEMVREARLELAHLAAPEPKSGASTNFATPAKMVATTGIEPVTPAL